NLIEPLENGAISVHRQPIYDIVSGRTRQRKGLYAEAQFDTSLFGGENQFLAAIALHCASSDEVIRIEKNDTSSLLSH
ncbi:hypothetical protein Tcan_04324, partial [Toxocara canis]